MLSIYQAAYRLLILALATSIFDTPVSCGEFIPCGYITVGYDTPKQEPLKYCIANDIVRQWRREYYQRLSLSETAQLWNCPRRCASWKASDYWYALLATCGQAIPHNQKVSIPPTYKIMHQDDTHTWYIDDTQRYLLFEQWPLYDYEQFWTFIRYFSDYNRCICTIYDFLQTHPHYQQNISSTATEFVLPGKLCTITQRICGILKPAVMHAIKVLSNKPLCLAPITSAKTAAKNMLLQMPKEFYALGIIADEALISAQTALRNFHKTMMHALREEIIILSALFDDKVKGFAESANKYLKIDYEHILGITIEFSRRGVPQINGFHHDFMHLVEQSGLFEFTNKICGSHGFYSADLFHLGKKVKRITFFPAEWSREQVIQSIYEAYNDWKNSNIAPNIGPDGKYVLKGRTAENIIIKMHVTPKGKVMTAYPDF